MPQTPLTVVLTQPMDDIRVPLNIVGNGKNLITVTRDTTAGVAFPYFSIAAGAGAPTDISVSIRQMTIRDAQGAAAGAGSLGGAINNAANLTLDNVDLRSNSANKGGAIYNATTGVLSLWNCVLANNQAVGNANEGGAIFATGNSRTSACNSTFETNTAAGGKGGATSFNVQSQLSLSYTNLTGNTAAEGGAVYASVGNAAVLPFLMRGGSMTSNTATSYGGAVFLSSTNARFNGVEFDENGAVKGGAIYSKLNVLELLNCNFFGNTAGTLGPILAYVGNLGETITITQTNCIGITEDDYLLDPNP
jgi:predicted outer membrane repeat protein